MNREVIDLRKKMEEMKVEHERQLIQTATINVMSTVRKLQTSLCKVAASDNVHSTLANLDCNFLRTEDAGDENEDNERMLHHRYGEARISTEKLFKQMAQRDLMDCIKSIAQRPEIIVNGRRYEVKMIDNA